MRRRVALVALVALAAAAPTALAAPRVIVAADLADRDGLAADWSAFLSGLVHGPELDRLTLRVVRPEAVARACADPGADACYDADTATAIIPARAGRDGVAPTELAAHEYGHHIAASRSHAPWDAFFYGTKRWSSYEDICRRARAHAVFPGGVGARYPLNTGEAFAEAYRLMTGGDRALWRVDPSLRPDATALRLLRRDVLSPWRGPRATRWSGRGGAARTVPTMLDGPLRARVVRGRVRLVLRAPDGRVLTTGRRVAGTVCGEDNFRLETRGRGRFTVEVTRP